MESSMDVVPRSAACLIADSLAVEHGTHILWNAVCHRLDADGRAWIAEGLETWWRQKGHVRSSFPDMIHAGPRAMTLVAHLHMVGQGELAEQVRVLLHGPELALKPSVTTTISQEWLDWFDAHTSPLLDHALLARGLVRRLRADAPRLEANAGMTEAMGTPDAVEAVLGVSSAPLVLEGRPFPAVGTPEEAAATAHDEHVTSQRLANEHGAEALGRALFRRLHAEGHHTLADLMRDSWLVQLVGMRVDAEKVATTLVAGLHERGRGDLADGVAARLRDMTFQPSLSAHRSLPATLTAEVLSWLGVYAAPDLHPHAVWPDLSRWLSLHGHRALAIDLQILLQPVVSPRLEDLRRSKDPYFDWLRERLEKRVATS